MRLPKRLTLEMLERIVADAVMVNLALLTAFALRFLSFFVLPRAERGPPCRPTPASSAVSAAPTSASSGC